jgi:UDP:flavonoid glycosyltransferase YjiC (YdhE family)
MHNATVGTNARVVVFGSPMAVGHVRPLMPLAARLVARGFDVVWAVSGDASEPASAWKEPFAKMGVTFVDVDAVAPFARNDAFPSASAASVYPRALARANDVAEGAAKAIAFAVAGRTVVAGVNDYFALWAYVAMRKLGIERIKTVVSSFASSLSAPSLDVGASDPVVQRELADLRSRHAGVGGLDRPLRAGLIPDDPSVEVLSFSSKELCLDPPDYVRLVGVHVDALPSVDDLGSAPHEHQALVRRLRAARESGARVVLLSVGTIVTKVALRMGPPYSHALKQLYSSVARAALSAGAIVVASTTVGQPEDFGVDEATLGNDARDRVIAMSFVPQPLLFAHGLVDVMLMHGGANTFHETVLAGIPVLVWPVFGDQESVAETAGKLGIGVPIKSLMFPNLAGAQSLARVTEEILPKMLAPGESAWKAAAVRLAERVKGGDGLDTAVALVTG